MAFHSDAEAVAVVERFQDLSLAKADWNHAAHLLVGLWYLDRHGLDLVRSLVPEAIRRYNAAVGTVDSPRGGYHETLTQFYLTLIDRFRRTWDGSDSLAERANALAVRLGDRDVVYRHYSVDRLWSPAARVSWLPPDIAELP